MVNAASLNITAINSTLNHMVQSSESSLNSELNTIGATGTPSSTDLIALQESLEGFSMSVQTTSTTVKDFYDALKEAISKA